MAAAGRRRAQTAGCPLARTTRRGKCSGIAADLVAVQGAELGGRRACERVKSEALMKSAFLC